MVENYLPVNYCMEDFIDLYQIEDDIPVDIWNRIVESLDQHVLQERLALIERIHEVVEVQLEHAGINFP